jgi:hypothetical protein
VNYFTIEHYSRRWLGQLLDYPLLDNRIRPVLLRGLLKFSKRFKQHPRCCEIPNLRLAGNPVAAGSFGDIWKTQLHNETVCVKVMRVYEEGDVEALLKVGTVRYYARGHGNLITNAGVPS